MYQLYFQHECDLLFEIWLAIVAIEDCNICEFEQADEKWLDFVSEHRNNSYVYGEYDIIIGPVADDQVYRVIQLYFSGAYDKQEAIKRLLPMKLKDQYVFCTKRSLEYLHFIKTIEE